MRHPVLGDMPVTRPEETAPWTICITNGRPSISTPRMRNPAESITLATGWQILGKFGILAMSWGSLHARCPVVISTLSTFEQARRGSKLPQLMPEIPNLPRSCHPVARVYRFCRVPHPWCRDTGRSIRDANGPRRGLLGRVTGMSQEPDGASCHSLH